MDRKTVTEGAREPRIGLGMPVFNGGAYLRETLESILAQTLADFELVICDNASTDDTAEICQEFARRDSRVRYLRNEQNIGAHPNYNRSFQEARGHYFKWVPHDDLLQPTFLESCVAALDAEPTAVLSQSWLDYVDGEGNPIGVYDSALTGTRDPDPARRFATVVLKPHPCYEVMGVFRRDALDRTGLLGSYHGADRTLLAELALLGKFVQVPQPLLVVRDHKERYTRAQLRPKDRAAWHDTRLAGRVSLPTWRVYSEYWSIINRCPLGGGIRSRARAALLRWWLTNYNAARMAVDLFAVSFPDMVGRAERLKQRLFSPAPGADAARETTGSRRD